MVNNIDFCLEALDTSLTEGFLEDNPFCLDFSDSGLVSLPPSEDEKYDEKGMDLAGDESSSTSSVGDGVVIIQPMESKDGDGACSAMTDFPVIAIASSIDADISDNDDDIEPLPFEYLSEFSESFPSSQEANETISIADAKKKLQACMRRSERTRRWIHKYVKKSAMKRRRHSVKLKVAKAVPVSPLSCRSFSKQMLGYRGKREVSPLKRNRGAAASQWGREPSAIVRGNGSFESSGVLHQSVRLVPVKKESSSISDFLRSKKSASVYIY